MTFSASWKRTIAGTRKLCCSCTAVSRADTSRPFTFSFVPGMLIWRAFPWDCVPPLVPGTMQPPHEFKSLKFETPEAVEGRKVVKDLGDDIRRQEKALKVSTSTCALFVGKTTFLSGSMSYQQYFMENSELSLVRYDSKHDTQIDTCSLVLGAKKRFHRVFIFHLCGFLALLRV